MRFRICIAALAMMFMAASAANAIIIDNFNSGGGDVQVDAGQIGVDSSFTDPGDAAGDHRTISVPGATDVTGLGMRIRANPSDLGFLAFSLETQSTGSGKVIWDGNGAGLGGLDITDAGLSDMLTFSVLEIDQGEVNLIFTITDTLGNESAVTIADAIIGVNNILLTDILNPGDLTDFTSVDMMMLEIQGSEASDLRIDQISTTNSVPEPASAALLGLGTLGFLRRRRTA